jgi:Uma2 family endonuclease
MAKPAEKRWTVDEFLAWDDGTGRRYELVDGRIVAMAPPSERTRRSSPICMASCVTA